MTDSDEQQPLLSDPFRPNQITLSSTKILLVYFFAVIKFLLFFVLLFLTSFYYLLASLVPINYVKKTIISLSSKVLLKLILYLFGVFQVPIHGTPLIDTYAETEALDDPKSGDIIVCCHFNYIDILWLQMKFNPIFAIPVSPSHLIVKSHLQLFFDIISCRSIQISNQRALTLGEIHEIGSRFKVPIILLVEGSVSNGQFILNFEQFGSNFDATGVTFHLYGFIHRTLISPFFVQGNGFLHILQMLGQFYNEMVIKSALPQDVPRTTHGIDDEWINRARRVMSIVLDCPTIDTYNSPFPPPTIINHERSLHEN